jgi:peptide chain release factor 1
MLRDRPSESTIGEIVPIVRLFYSRCLELDYRSQWCEEVISIHDEWQRLKLESTNLKSIEIEPNDDLAWRSLVDIENTELELKIADLQQQLNILFIDIYPLKHRNVFVEVCALDGGDEANIWVEDLERMYTSYAEDKNWKVELVSHNFNNAILKVRGLFVGCFLEFETGIHQVKRKLLTARHSHKIHVSTAVVTVMPTIDEHEIEIDPRDLELTTAWGCHLRIRAAVALRHKPTQTYVVCDLHEKQYKNKENAIEIMRSKLYTLNSQDRRGEDRDRTPQIIRTYDYETRIVTNLKSGMQFPLDRILQGELDPSIASNTNNHPII